MIKINKCVWREPIKATYGKFEISETIDYCEMQSVICSEPLIPFSEVDNAIRKMRRNYALKILDMIKRKSDELIAENPTDLTPRICKKIIEAVEGEGSGDDY